MGASRPKRKAKSAGRPPDKEKYLPRDAEPGERELLLGWGSYMQGRYANSKRVGCPDKAVLQQMAKDSSSFRDQAVIDHASHCAPCSNELQKLIHKARKRRPAANGKISKRR